MTAVTCPPRPSLVVTPTTFERMLLAVSDRLELVARHGMARRQAEALRAREEGRSLAERLAPLTAYDQLHIR